MFGNLSQPTCKAKACTQCGTTKTPQWREGPAGPKTLCNACGVKRVRQMRVVQDGQKQKGNDDRHTKASAIPYQVQNVVALSPVVENAEKNGTVPVRSARKRVARTQDDGYLYGDDAFEEVARPTLKRLRSLTTNDSDPTDSGGEEMSWTPMTNNITQEVNAAVDLLAMSMPAEVVAQAQMLNVQDSLKAAETKANSSFPPAQLKDEMARYGLDLETLTEDKVEVLMDAWVDAEKTRKEACVACDAVAAVAQVLAVKQAASIQAKSSALVAARKLRHVFAGLDSRQAPRLPKTGSVPRRPRTTSKAKAASPSVMKHEQQGANVATPMQS